MRPCRLVLVVALTAGCSVSAHVSLHRSSQPPSNSSSSSAAETRGTVRGRLVASGVATLAVPGTILVAPGDIPPMPTGPDGRFALALAPGTYTLTGRSPRYEDGRGLCRAGAPIDVVAGRTVTADIVCAEK